MFVARMYCLVPGSSDRWRCSPTYIAERQCFELPFCFSDTPVEPRVISATVDSLIEYLLMSWYISSWASGVPSPLARARLVIWLSRQLDDGAPSTSAASPVCILQGVSMNIRPALERT